MDGFAQLAVLYKAKYRTDVECRACPAHIRTYVTEDGLPACPFEKQVQENKPKGKGDLNQQLNVFHNPGPDHALLYPTLMNTATQISDLLEPEGPRALLTQALVGAAMKEGSSGNRRESLVAFLDSLHGSSERPRPRRVSLLSPLASPHHRAGSR
jgi:hypothetical protein